MASLNKVQIIGHVGKDPEIRSLQDGSRVASFSLAVSESWRDKATGERKEKTEWVKCVSFNDHMNKVIEAYVHKGSKIYFEGALQTRSWNDKDGATRYATEVVAQRFAGHLILLDGRRESEDTGGYSSNVAGSAPRPPAPDLDDDIPFAPLRELP